jgi:DNA polymerase V
MIAAPKKAIATTRSFESLIDDYQELRERDFDLCESVRRKAAPAKQQMPCAMYVFVRSNPFMPDLPQYRNSTMISLPFATNSSLTLSKTALHGLRLDL